MFVPFHGAKKQQIPELHKGFSLNREGKIPTD
jgi:hypothetical protein